MSTSESNRADGMDSILHDLHGVRGVAGAVGSFWQNYAEVLCRMAGARVCAIVVRQADQPDWRRVTIQPAVLQAGTHGQLLMEHAQSIAEACERADDGVYRTVLPGDEWLCGVRQILPDSTDVCVALFYRRNAPDEPGELLTRLRLIADTPGIFQGQRASADAKLRVAHLGSVLDLMVLVNAQDRYLSAAMVLCNEIAARHNCERVSLGWIKQGYIRMQAMSHIEHFDKRMEAVQLLEAAMEEAFDQDTEVAVPVGEPGSVVTRDHEAFSVAQGVVHMCSLPLRVDGEPVAVVTCERREKAFDENELRLLRLACDQSARRLHDLQMHDRWWGARFAAWGRERLSSLIGAQHTWAKVMVVLAFVLLAFLCFARVPYRVEASFIARTEEVVYLAAPFDAHIAFVGCRVGQSVDPGKLLLAFDKRDLELERAAAVADLNRAKREAEKARAQGALADMQIARATADRAQARLDKVEYRLAQSEIRAPGKSVVAEGDLMERIGAPVKQGDVLFKLARMDTLFIELEVPERDIHQLRHYFPVGEIAFSSRPQDRYPFQVERVEPVAVTKDDGNVFIVHAKFTGERERWWRPGMTGVAKIDAGRRTPLWILTHRTVDFLRMKLWW